MYTYEGYQPLRDIANAAVRSQINTEFPARVLVTAAACESGWFTKVTGAFNYYGITRLPEAGLAKLCVTHEDITSAQLEAFDLRERATAIIAQDKEGKDIELSGGRFRYNMKRYFAVYGSIGESVVAYTEFFTKSPHRYAEAWQAYLQDKDEKALLDHICQAGYATGDAQTTEDVIFDQVNIAHSVEMAQKANGVIS